VAKAALVALFQALKDNVRVVVFNARYASDQAEAVSGIIDCTIGMSKAIGDRAAVVFAATFYRAIGFGRSVQEAFDLGKNAILLEGIPEQDTPALYARKGVDPGKMVLVRL
jgi:hypothetical protein